MKTKSFLLGAASLMLAASCSNDEVVNVAPQSGAIGFSSFVNNSTRGDDFGSSNLPANLNVYGVTSRTEEGVQTVSPFAVFTGTVVTNNINNLGIWSYSPVQYWIAGNDYTFAAVAPANQENVKVNQTLLTANAGIENITFENDGDLDLLFAEAGVPNAAANNDPVKFTLNHLLSRVRFQFDNGLSNGYSVKVVGLKIKDAIKNATYVPGTGWTGTKDDAFDFGTTTDLTANNGNVVSDHHYLVPEAGAAYKVSFDVELWYAEEGKAAKKFNTYSHTATLPTTLDLVAGYSYTLKTQLNWSTIDPENNPQPIQFEVVKVTEWQNWVEKDYALDKKETEAPAVGEESNENN